jgi:type II secretory pathway pseudopilin PulG
MIPTRFAFSRKTFLTLLLVIVILLIAYNQQQEQQQGALQQEQQVANEEQIIQQQQQEQQQQNLGVVISQGNATVPGTYCFNFDTGAPVNNMQSCEAWWEIINSNQRELVTEGGSSFATISTVYFPDIDLAYLKGLSYSITEISGSQLTRGFIFGVHTSEGNFAKVRVLYSGYDLEFEWVTYSDS